MPPFLVPRERNEEATAAAVSTVLGGQRVVLHGVPFIEVGRVDDWPVLIPVEWLLSDLNLDPEEPKP